MTYNVLSGTLSLYTNMTSWVEAYKLVCVVECRANLSELYFTHRQDRYIMLSKCPSLADFFDRLVSAVQRYSFHLQPDDSVELADGVTSHPFAGTAVDCWRLRCILLCRGYMWSQIISKLLQPSSTSVRNNFISARGNLPEVISQLFHRLIAALEYFPTCFHCRWNNFGTPSWPK